MEAKENGKHITVVHRLGHTVWSIYEIMIVHNYYRTIKQLISENKCLQWLCKGFS